MQPLAHPLSKPPAQPQITQLPQFRTICANLPEEKDPSAIKFTLNPELPRLNDCFLGSVIKRRGQS